MLRYTGVNVHATVVFGALVLIKQVFWLRVGAKVRGIFIGFSALNMRRLWALAAGSMMSFTNSQSDFCASVLVSHWRVSMPSTSAKCPLSAPLSFGTVNRHSR